MTGAGKPRLRSLQVRLPEGDLAALRQLAAKRNVSISNLIRQSVKMMLEREELWERASRAIGIGNSGVSDIARRHDDYLAEAYMDWKDEERR
jgi:Arc/MetJ-type ribon-helix-helix transcriptional regulator